MKKSFIYIAAILLISISSCTVTEPLLITNNKIGDKVGASKNSWVFAINYLGVGPGTPTSYGICFNKDYGPYEAALDGDIVKIATVDLKTTNYVFFTKYELIITGE